MKKFILFITVFVCFIVGTNAQIIHIPSDHSTIQAGIDAASDGDTVLVAEGTYFENINFKGKAITVASRFILDGDTSHISKTIIDGSKSTNPDAASVVTISSGEDTTSVLMGFTITGGSGTITNYLGGYSGLLRGGGGIFIDGCGGKITNNIIEKNNVSEVGSQNAHVGGGICARVYNNHSLIIRNNIIRGNKVLSNDCVMGGGIAAWCGRIICENNKIINNGIVGTVESEGGGISGVFWDYSDAVKVEGVIHEAIIRNNIIDGNISDSQWQINGGGGYYQFSGYGGDSTLVYNNIICNNRTNTGGGGMFFINGKGRFFNNTIVDNTAGWDANCIAICYSAELTLYNNIMWRNVSSTKNEYWVALNSDTDTILFFNNILMTPLKTDDSKQQDQLVAFNNSYAEPIFQEGSYKLAENSPGIGFGIDTLFIPSLYVWYYSPATDVFGNTRPDPVDQYVDVGAVESPFSKPASVVYKNMFAAIKLFPVPVDNTLYIETSEAVLSVEVFNMIGVKVLDKSKPEGRIDMSQLEQGMYLIRIRTDRGEVFTGKVMKK